MTSPPPSHLSVRPASRPRERGYVLVILALMSTVLLAFAGYSVDLGNWNAVLFGSVRVIGRDGSVLKTRRLEWDSKSEVLTAPWLVRVRSGQVDLRGVRLTADLKKNRAKIEGRVNTVIRPPSGFLEPAT